MVTTNHRPQSSECSASSTVQNLASFDQFVSFPLPILWGSGLGHAGRQASKFVAHLPDVILRYEQLPIESLFIVCCSAACVPESTKGVWATAAAVGTVLLTLATCLLYFGSVEQTFMRPDGRSAACPSPGMSTETQHAERRLSVSGQVQDRWSSSCCGVQMPRSTTAFVQKLTTSAFLSQRQTLTPMPAQPALRSTAAVEWHSRSLRQPRHSCCTASGSTFQM